MLPNAVQVDANDSHAHVCSSDLPAEPLILRVTALGRSQRVFVLGRGRWRQMGGVYTGRLGGRRNSRGVVKSVPQELGCLSLNAGSTTYQRGDTGQVPRSQRQGPLYRLVPITQVSTTGARVVLPAFQSWLHHFLTV